MFPECAPLQVLGQWSGLFHALPPRFMSDLMEVLSFLNVNFMPFINLECMSPGASYFYANMMLKASIPLWLVLFASGAFYYLKRKAKTTHDEAGLQRIDEYKEAVVVFTLFMINLLHPSTSTSMFKICDCKSVRHPFDVDCDEEGELNNTP
jgi:hypothetical protein